MKTYKILSLFALIICILNVIAALIPSAFLIHGYIFIEGYHWCFEKTALAFGWVGLIAGVLGLASVVLNGIILGTTERINYAPLDNM